jgi:hypothetical protein
MRKVANFNVGWEHAAGSAQFRTAHIANVVVKCLELQSFC